MASTSRDGETPDGIEFSREADGTVTARDVETGLARGGETKAEALVRLAEVLALEAGDGSAVDDPEAFLRSIGVDPEDAATDEFPWG